MPNRVALFFVFLLIAGCALVPTAQPPLPADPVAGRCLDLYKAMDQAVAEAGVTPSYPVRIAGFPYLRVNRFLAGYRDEPLNTAELAAWWAQLAKLDREARAVELASLPEPVVADLARRYGLFVEKSPLRPPFAKGGTEELAIAKGGTRELAVAKGGTEGLALSQGDGGVPANFLFAALATCARQLQASDLENAERLRLLRERAAVPSEYRTHKQILGVYPISILPVHYGIYRWHRQTRDVFAQPLEVLPVEGELQRFQPPQATVKPPAFVDVPRDALAIPHPDPGQLDALFALHAPVWEIDVAGDFDRPGVPFWQQNGIPSVDPTVPVTYRYSTYTRWRGEPLLQLNYLVWFAERPLTHPLDIYGGAVDGVVWRVTLDRNGTALLYDSIHPCGCYHKFFPSGALRLRPEAEHLPEPPLLPQPAPIQGLGERIVVRLESATHYIQRAYTDVSTGMRYAWRDYQELYATPQADGDQRSLFDPDNGLIPGTERLERWLLWPMGVPSPGAMRERGRNATAFVGRRHFDSPDLFERLFEPVEMTR